MEVLQIKGGFFCVKETERIIMIQIASETTVTAKTVSPVIYARVGW